eukprot:scaffold8068_cov565-Prasinococcus_capsulatus_cf.AAC.1
MPGAGRVLMFACNTVNSSRLSAQASLIIPNTSSPMRSSAAQASSASTTSWRPYRLSPEGDKPNTSAG